MRLDDLHTFVLAVDAGSFRAAAERLGVPTSTVSRRVARLEDTLGLPLVHRGRRRTEPTAEGRALAVRSRPALHELARLDRSADGPRGLLRLTAPTDLGSTEPFLHLLHSFRQAHPELDLEVELSNRSVDLVQEGFDLALRPHSGSLRAVAGLMARRVGTIRGALYAAPTLPLPSPLQSIADLPPTILMHRALRERWPHPDQVRVTATDFQLLLGLAARGGGVAVAPSFAATPWLRDGTLVAVPIPLPFATVGRLSVLWPEARHLAPRIRAFLDHLDQLQADDPGWALH